MYVILLSILCYDIWFYVSHVLLHRAWTYRRIHWIHHQKIEPTALDTYEGHVLEGPLQSLGTVVPFFFMHYTWLDVVLVLIFLNARGMARHDARMVWLVGESSSSSSSFSAVELWGILARLVMRNSLSWRRVYQRLDKVRIGIKEDYYICEVIRQRWNFQKAWSVY